MRGMRRSSSCSQGGPRAGPLRGYEVDRVARAVITGAGYGSAFVHRTGHSIDHRLHGSGPHLDDYETHDDRQFLAGTGFSVEPGVYLTGRFGIRSEVNMYLTPGEAIVTPVRAPSVTSFSEPRAPAERSSRS